MLKDHFQRYLESDFNLEIAQEEGAYVLEGVLTRKRDGKAFPVVRGIPRLIEKENYADNFGIQWNHFDKTQLDSASRSDLTRKRFWENTRWTPDELRGKTVLEVGSGAGRFTELLLEAGAHVVSFDLSDAVEANFRNNSERGDLFLFQGSIYDIPFPPETFDFAFCYGVLQHTPDPDLSYREIFSRLKKGGEISIDYYQKFFKPTPWTTAKYLWRPLTTRIPAERLFKIIQWYIPRWLPIDTALKRTLYKLPRFGGVFTGLIPVPCFNYLDWDLDDERRLEWAIMDTFDALGAKYDFPKTLEEVRVMVDSPENAKAEIFYGSNGIVANVRKSA